MVWCSSCARHVTGHRPYDSQLCCDRCGKVLEDHNFSTEATFVKNAAGQSQLSGNFVRTIQSEYGASRERLMEKAFDDMRQMKNALNIGESDEIVHVAKRFYGIAVARNFTKGRRTEQVQASCLYLACRYDILSSIIFALWFLDMGMVVSTVDTDIIVGSQNTRMQQKGHQFAHTRWELLRLEGDDREFLEKTGRKPSGLCGAALYISALTHGLKFSKSDIVKIVHICEATLMKRLIEFENTDSGSLTIEDFMARKKELHEGVAANLPNNGPKVSGMNEVLCKHKDTGKPFACGLCRSCYEEFMTISEGLEGGADPPAFQVAERERMVKASAEENSSTASNEGEGDHTKTPGVDATTEASDGSDNFSDIDDFEVDGYLHNEEEKHYKKIIWEEMNREYLEEQAAKEAAAAAAKAALEASYKNCPEGLQAAQELAAAAAAAVAKSRKEKQQKRAAEAKNSGPAQTALEATRRMLTKKRLSSKINYDVLEKLFDDSVTSENPKKKRTDSHSDYDDKFPNNGKKEHESEDLGPEGDFDANGDVGEAYENELDYGNVDEAYDFDDGYDYDGF
ncbi:cyclin/Brf1-like TBP-binding protein [Citrus sinensis]|uniref:Cyclin/Brf1-like TBP-binding protein n=1 Tax=Citrus sinensis TaxID=2711 RepID=A0ACB8MFY4_CITSI|nr:cyclin/Brf1-like TBP-binding protein [Citrus sinensis]